MGDAPLRGAATGRNQLQEFTTPYGAVQQQGLTKSQKQQRTS
jgi:hypothetical protein